MSLAMLLVAGVPGCAASHRPSAARSSTPREATERGRASWYGKAFQGRPTASGERFDMNARTAAHRTLPFGTHVRVTNLENGKQIVVRINDRGPFVKGRIIDLSYAAARQIGMVRAGVVPVRIEVLSGR